MLNLAIEIGTDNVRAAIRKRAEYRIVPLGLFSSPYSCPPIGLHLGHRYMFGEAAKLNALTKPDETVFLSDYTRKDGVSKKAFIAFINFVCQRVAAIFKETVTEITFIIPHHLNNSHIQSFIGECITSSGHTAVMAKDPAVSFVRSNFNVESEGKVCVIDLRDSPAYAAVVSRSAQEAFTSLGGMELAGFSIKDCESIVEDAIIDEPTAELVNSDIMLSEWVQTPDFITN